MMRGTDRVSYGRAASNPRRFQRNCNILHVLLTAGCILAMIFSWKGTTLTMKGFPVLFLCGAGMNLMTAVLRFRRGPDRRRRIGQGIFYILMGLFLLGVACVCMECVW